MQKVLCKKTDFGINQFRVFEIENSTDVIVFKLSEFEYSALEDRCSHADVRLSGGECIDNCIECPAHGARFDILTGKVQCMPAVTAVKKYNVTIINDNLVIDF